MTNLLQWGAGSLLEACSTFAIPCASPAARSSCFSQEGDGSAGQEEGFSFPLPISLVYFTLFTGKPKQSSSIHLFFPNSLKTSWRKRNLVIQGLYNLAEDLCSPRIRHMPLKPAQMTSHDKIFNPLSAIIAKSKDECTRSVAGIAGIPSRNTTSSASPYFLLLMTDCAQTCGDVDTI